MRRPVTARGEAHAHESTPKRWLIVGAFLALVACSKDKDVDLPVPLPLFSAAIKVEKVWSVTVADKGAKPLRLGLGLAIDGERVYAAGHRGEVAAFNLKSGRLIWRTKTKAALAGGPGLGAGLVVVGSSFGDVIALDADTGVVHWKLRVNGEVLAAPAVSERLVAVRTVDGKLRGLSVKDGKELWAQDQQVPRLSLRGTSLPVMTGDLVLSGFDNGKVAAVNIGDGSVQWETTIAPAHGKTELERLDDVDSAVRVAGADVYAVGFQGRVAMLALDTGQIWWSHEASSYRPIGLDDNALYVSTADGEIIALGRRTGVELWRQKALLHRRLSAAIETDSAIVTADYQGYVHWLDKTTGAIVARASSGKVRVSNAPVAVGNMVLVVNDVGHITAFRATPIPGARPVAPAQTQTAVPVPAAPVAPASAPAPMQSATPDSPSTPADTPPDAAAPTPPSGTSDATVPAPSDATPPAPQSPREPPPLLPPQPQTQPQPPPS